MGSLHDQTLAGPKKVTNDYSGSVVRLVVVKYLFIDVVPKSRYIKI